MFEIGSTLRETRVRRNLTLQQAEADTKIRVKYLQALENEDFDVLPGGTYVKGFLRTYATYLGLDADVVLAEFNSRVGPDAEPEPFSGSSALRPRSHRRRNTLAFVAVICLLLLAVIYVLGLGRQSEDEQPPTTPSALGVTSASPTHSPGATPKPKPSQAKVVKGLKITAVDGDCWLEVRKGEAGGEVLFAKTLRKGSTKLFQGEAFWVRFGAPRKVGVRVNGRKTPLADDPGPLTYLVADGKLVRQD